MHLKDDGDFCYQQVFSLEPYVNVLTRSNLFLFGLRIICFFPSIQLFKASDSLQPNTLCLLRTNELIILFKPLMIKNVLKINPKIKLHLNRLWIR